MGFIIKFIWNIHLLYNSHTRPLKTIHTFTRKRFSLNNHYHAHCVQLEMKHNLHIPFCQQVQQDNLSNHLKGLFSLSSGQAAFLKPSPGGCVCLSCCASVPVWCLSRRFEGLQSLLIAQALGHDKTREEGFYLQYCYTHFQYICFSEHVTFTLLEWWLCLFKRLRDQNSKPFHWILVRIWFTFQVWNCISGALIMFFSSLILPLSSSDACENPKV